MVNLDNLKTFGMGCWPCILPPKHGNPWPSKLAFIFKYIDSFVVVNARNPQDILAECFFNFTIKRKIKKLERQGWTIVPYK